MNRSPFSSRGNKPGWRRAAAQIVEQLFEECPRDSWDELLDLWGLLLSGEDWEQALNLFLNCRSRLEADHYLPFYRLRILIAGSLRLESAGKCGGPDLMSLLRRKHLSLGALHRDAVGPNFGNADRAGFRLVEIS